MKNKKLGLYISILLMLVATILWFSLDAIELKVGSTTISASFLDLTFGKSTNILFVEVEVFKFSFLNLLLPILLIIGMVLPVLAVVNKKINKSNSFIMIVVSILVIALALLVRPFAVPARGDLQDFQLAIGVYLIAGLGLLNAALQTAFGYFIK